MKVQAEQAPTRSDHGHGQHRFKWYHGLAERIRIALGVEASTRVTKESRWVTLVQL